MRAYLNVFFNHIRAIQAWAADKDARLTLDLRTFEAQIKFRGRYYTLFPMFVTRSGERLAHATVLTQDTFAFGGWRPYRPVTHEYSTHKLRFKEFLRRTGTNTPRILNSPEPGAKIPFDYLLKADVGSFGAQILGPFVAGTPLVDAVQQSKVEQRSTFIEEFIQGSILKVWFWGERPFFAHSHAYPNIAGDGVAAVQDLLRTRFRECDLDWERDSSQEVILSCLRFQGVSSDSVLPTGDLKWIDFRYGHHYQRPTGPTPLADGSLANLLASTGDQVAAMGKALSRLLKETFPAPILVSVDGMLDDKGSIHWLEMNTNSIMPPEGYAVMFEDLFS